MLGWQTWREIETRHGLEVITQNLQATERGGLLALALLPVLAQLVLSAVIEAALLIAHAPNPKAARAGAKQALFALLSGTVSAATGDLPRLS